MSHYYTLTGETAYEVVGANGKTRPTTIRDARKLNLVPSVTTIMSLQDSPQLNMWKQNQLIEAILRNPHHPILQDEDEWRRIVLNDALTTTQAATINGTKIHDALENALKNNVLEPSTKEIVDNVLSFLDEKFAGYEWVCEDSFAHPSGFGGKIDLYGVKGDKRLVLDFKTKQKNKESISKIKPFDNHHMQTAAYVKGLEDTKKFSKPLDYSKWGRYNLFIGYDEHFSFTGIKLTQSSDWDREWGMFEKLLEFWKLRNKY